MKGKVYKKEEIQEEGAALFEYEFKDLKFLITYKENYFGNMSHMGFYALSRGFEKFTETGYKSTFVQGNLEGLDIRKEIEIFMRDKLAEAGIDLENPMPIYLAEVGGVKNKKQLTFF